MRLNDHVRANDAHARRLLRMSVLLLADSDARSQRASELFMTEAFEHGAGSINAFLAQTEAAGTIDAIHLGPEGTYLSCSRGLAVPREDSSRRP